MTRVHMICEGQTEETFANEILKPHFSARGVYLTASLIGKRGGNFRFHRLHSDVRNYLRADKKITCTTFFDFYGLPPKFPGKSEADRKSSPAEKSETLCAELVSRLQEEIGENAMRRFIPYVQMFEFEALLFSDPAGLAKGIGKPKLQGRFCAIRREYESPEHINDSEHKAPSKRIESTVPGYEKPTMGTLAALEITLQKMRAECILFDAWVGRLEGLPAGDGL